MTMKFYRTFWLLLTMMMVGSFTLTSCVDNQDNPSGGGGGGDKDKKYVERLVPVVDPQENVLGSVLLRFYNDMPNVAYISVSHFQEIMYPGTTIQVQIKVRLSRGSRPTKPTTHRTGRSSSLSGNR